MTKEELIRYLNACLEAEDGLYESRRLVAQLTAKAKDIDHQVYEVIPPDLPGKPVLEPPYQDRREDCQMMIERCKKNISTAYLSLDLKEANKWKESLRIAEGKLREAEFEYVNRAEIEQSRTSRFEAADAEWKQKNEKYHESIMRQGQLVLRGVLEEKTKQEERMASFQKTLNDLYNMGIIYENFRNPNAIMRILEYLRMGVTDTLEGPTGAYRFYMDDLRADRIVGSIEELRASVEKGFYYMLSGQQTLHDQLVVMNDSLKEIDRNVGGYFDRLYSQIKETGKAVAQEIKDASMYEREILGRIQEDQAQIGNIIANSAYNQYLVDRRNNLDNYLVYQLHNPLL